VGVHPEDQIVANYASGRPMPWDPLWLGAFRCMARLARFNPYVSTALELWSLAALEK
jgi:hypothetical protein